MRGDKVKKGRKKEMEGKKEGRKGKNVEQKKVMWNEGKKKCRMKERKNLKERNVG